MPWINGKFVPDIPAPPPPRAPGASTLPTNNNRTAGAPPPPPAPGVPPPPPTPPMPRPPAPANRGGGGRPNPNFSGSNAADAAPPDTGGQPPANLMSYDQWYNEAKANAAKSGQTFYEQNAKGDYEKYKWSASNPGQTNQSFRGSYSGSGEHNGYDANYGAGKMSKPGANASPDDIRRFAWDQGWGSDDLGEFDNATIAQWIKDGKWDAAAGKFRNDYGDLVEKPTEDGPLSAGRQALYNSGRYSDPSQVPRQGAAGGGGGGGQGGSGGGPAGGGGYVDEMTEYWKNLVKNQDKSRYSPEAMAAIEADMFARARAQEKNQLDDARADMAERGVARSGNQNAVMRGIRSGTGAAIMQNRAQVVRAKIDADYQDKQAAINNAKEWVNSMRDYMLRTDMNAIQREQIAAQIRLANMNIQAQQSQLEQQYQNNLSTYLLTNGG